MPEEGKRLQEYVDQIAAYETSEKIADYLISEGVKGEPQRTGSCALAQWLKKETGSHDISVGGTWARDWSVFNVDTTEEQIARDYAVIPANVTQFINDFDNGTYPELLTEYYRGIYATDAP